MGFDNIQFNVNEIIKILSNHHVFDGKYFTAMGKCEWERMRNNSAYADKRTLINSVDFIFTASETIKDVDNSLNNLKEEFLNHKLLHCSDAHRFCEQESCTKPKDLGHCFSWIKAESSFEGLKALLYEYDLRVKFSNSSPNNKAVASVIRSVRFHGHQDFNTEKIYLNPDLNSIIGGKSSGKSLLLHYMAHTIDSAYAIKQENGGADGFQKNDIYKFSNQENFDFIVEWNDGVEFNLKNLNTSGSRKFVYIPQAYILTLTSNIENNSRKELGKLIREILKQNEAARTSYDNFIENVRSLDKQRDNCIENYFEIRHTIYKLNENKKNIGDTQGIENQITKYQKQLIELKGNSISDIENTKYNILNKMEHAVFQVNMNIENDFGLIANTLSSIKEDIVAMENKTKDCQDKLGSKYFKDICIDMLAKFQKFNELIISKENFKDEIHTKVLKRIDKIDAIIIESLTPLKEKFKYKEEIESLEKLIKAEKLKLAQLEILDKSIELEEENRKKKINELKDSYTRSFNEYKKIIEILNKQSNLFEGFEIRGSVKFYYNRFCDNFLNFIDQRSTNLSEFNLLKSRDKNNLPDIDLESHLDEIMKIFELIINKTTLIKKSQNEKDCIKGLFKDEFFDYWELIVENDEIANMSPGKANLAILKLLIDLNTSNCPILIDQPEDNLDNRSIYVDLVKYIRKRKLNRQLIVVTHNPNIVVAADSENIIVANQNGQEKSRDNKNFRFEYINGALENTFINNAEKGILNQKGIKEHITEILEGGEEAFKKREQKYGF